MRIADVVSQAALVLPQYTGLFHDALDVTDITASGGVATVTTATPHGLETGQSVNLSGVETRTVISAASKTGNIVTFTTATDHDLTEGWPENEKITLTGFDTAGYNAEFTLQSANNRRTFAVQTALAAPTGTLGVLLEPYRVDGVNGYYAATVVDSTTFTISGTFADGDYTPVNGVVSTNVRMAGTVNINEALTKQTSQPLNKYYLWVEPLDVTVSKDRSTDSDAIAQRSSGQDMRTRLLDGFSVYIVAPCKDALLAVPQLDICRYDLQFALMRTFYGVKFDTGLTSVSDFKTILAGHEVYAYERAFLVYRYEFQVIADLTNGDQVLPSQTRAFRDVDYTQLVGGSDTPDLTVEIDLDDDPL